jgi:hypothetical protein
VTVPSIAREAARDLVRAREDVRGDLMAARHRLSKPLPPGDRLLRRHTVDPPARPVAARPTPRRPVRYARARGGVRRRLRHAAGHDRPP